MEKIYEITNGDAIITTDVGQHQMWAAQHYKFKEPRTLLTSGGLGTMGYGLGACIGAKVGRKDKTVVNIAGDGCFRMNMNEVEQQPDITFLLLKLYLITMYLVWLDSGRIFSMARDIQLQFLMIRWILLRFQKEWEPRLTVLRQ